MGNLGCEIFGGKNLVQNLWWEIFSGKFLGGIFFVGKFWWEIPDGKFLVGNFWWEILGRKFLVRNSWWEILGGKFLDGNLWWEILGGKFSVVVGMSIIMISSTSNSHSSKMRSGRQALLSAFTLSVLFPYDLFAVVVGSIPRRGPSSFLSNRCPLIFLDALASLETVVRVTG